MALEKRGWMSAKERPDLDVTYALDGSTTTGYASPRYGAGSASLALDLERTVSIYRFVVYTIVGKIGVLDANTGTNYNIDTRQNIRHYSDIFLNENVWNELKISLKFVPKVRIDIYLYIYIYISSTALTSLVPKAHQHNIRHYYTNTNDTIWNIRMSYPSIVEYMNNNIAILCQCLSRTFHDAQRIPLLHGLSINETIAYDSYFRCGDGKKSNCAG